MRNVSANTVSTVFTVTSTKTGGALGYVPEFDRTYRSEFPSSGKGQDSIRYGDHKTPLAYAAFKYDGYPLRFSAKRTRLVNHYWKSYQHLVAAGSSPVTNSILLFPYMAKFIDIESGLTCYRLTPHSGNIARARNKMLRKLADSTELDLGQTIGEIRTTAAMMRARLFSFLYAYRSIRNGNWALAAKHLGIPGFTPKSGAKDVSNIWLEYRFGWRPLVNDIMNGYSSIRDALSREGGPTIKQKVRVRTNANPSLVSLRYVRTGKITYDTEIGISYKISNLNRHKLGSVGLGSLASTAWELMPLSFVVDWMVSIGSFLDGLSATDSLEFFGGYETSRVSSSVTVEDTGLLDAYFSEISGYTFMASSAMSRTPLFTFPSPGIHFTMSPSETKFVDLIGLLYQRR